MVFLLLKTNNTKCFLSGVPLSTSLGLSWLELPPWCGAACPSAALGVQCGFCSGCLSFMVGGRGTYICIGIWEAENWLLYQWSIEMKPGYVARLKIQKVFLHMMM